MSRNSVLKDQETMTMMMMMHPTRVVHHQTIRQLAPQHSIRLKQQLALIQPMILTIFSLKLNPSAPPVSKKSTESAGYACEYSVSDRNTVSNILAASNMAMINSRFQGTSPISSTRKTPQARTCEATSASYILRSMTRRSSVTIGLRNTNYQPS